MAICSIVRLKLLLAKLPVVDQLDAKRAYQVADLGPGERAELRLALGHEARGRGSQSLVGVARMAHQLARTFGQIAQDGLQGCGVQESGGRNAVEIIRCGDAGAVQAFSCATAQNAQGYRYTELLKYFTPSGALAAKQSWQRRGGGGPRRAGGRRSPELRMAGMPYSRASREASAKTEGHMWTC